MPQGPDTIQEITELNFVLGDNLFERLMTTGITLDHAGKSVRIRLSIGAATKKRITVKPLPKPKKEASAKPTKTRRKKSR